ncbi:TFIIB-type zinc ribbon-containing protein [Halorientalis brevis]|uniref:TFIIB-type zinc ribbon-containing protein n=1 Tax=Halorientalis brevis TaxID=1126241 RepID=A0ABD6CGC9_9EURY|nr:TFIIB-type zinc ribbon-containing protein [Halorientalis brevis]
MKIRGDRQCKECDTRWSYYETGSITCPECGSLKSVGVDDRKEHTASAVVLDLTGVRAQVDEVPLRDVAADAADTCRSYVRQYGFIDAGELQPLADAYLAARELRQAAGYVERAMRLTDDEEYYLLALLRGADQGDRPATDAVPASMRDARGLAYATAVDHYRSDLRLYLEENPDETAQQLLASLGEHQKRIAALDGDVALGTSEALITAVQSLGRYLIDDDENALAQAQHRLDTLNTA